MKWFYLVFLLFSSYGFGQKSYAIYDLKDRLEDIHRYQFALYHVEEFVQAKTDTLEMMQNEIESYTPDGCFGRSWSEETLERKMKEMQMHYDRFQAFQAQVEKDVEQLQDRVISPVLVWIDQRLIEYKREKEIDFLFNKEYLLYFGEDCEDITDEFIDYLNQK